ncbi:MAG: hypothetical protein AMXMBFR58_36860 [Phycisphaerae bacterium]
MVRVLFRALTVVTASGLAAAAPQPVSKATAGGPAGAGRIEPPIGRTPPSALPGLEYDVEFFPGESHDAGVPTPDSVLGFRLGDKPVTHAEVETVIRAISSASQRCRLFEYGKTHEGRTLYYVAVGTEQNIRNLDRIKADSAKLADPRSVSAADADELIRSMPAVAWMCYVIHGDEMSGTDASLALLWHLASGTGESVTNLLKDVVVIIDPLMNPDGRDRRVTNIRQNRTVAPSVDDQALLHTGVWPSGRMNHYLFDMNRDWIYGTQPETRGRIAAVREWNPHYFMESHEMGSQDTFLFMPPREPVNPNISPRVREWKVRFAQDQAAAFDGHGWRYYTGEWNEGWYPGYSGAWASMRGIVDNLYEQANIQTDGVRRAEGTIETYRESVHKQLVSSIANLRTLAANKVKLLTDYVADRRENVAEAAAGPGVYFGIPVDRANAGRVELVLRNLDLQGIEWSLVRREVTVSGRDWLGREFKDRTLAANAGEGLVVVSPRQPLGKLAAAMLGLDPRPSDAFMTEERRELLRFGRSRLYDITGWNPALLAGVEVFEAPGPAPVAAETGRQAEAYAWLRSISAEPAGNNDNQAPPVAFAVDGSDDRSVVFASHLMDRDVRVRITNKPTELDGAELVRGSVVVTVKDNQDFTGDLAKVVRETAEQSGVGVRPLATGLGPGDSPDMGGEHFVLLSSPSIAVVVGDPFNPYSAGEIWHQFDHEMGMRASYITSEVASSIDLRRYNVIVLPDGGAPIAEKMMESLRSWTQAGGTLVAVGSTCSAFAKEKDGLGSTRLLQDVLTKRDDYRLAIIRDWLGRSAEADTSAAWSFTAPTKIEYPWTIEPESVSEDEAKRRDAWRSIFMPQGAIMAARVDDRSWLTAGSGDVLPVLVGDGPVLIPSSGMNAPVLMGAIVPGSSPSGAGGERGEKGGQQTDAGGSEHTPANGKEAEGDGDKKDDKKKEEPKPGWTVAPPGHELRLRMSGMLWPEAADRIAHSAYVTREGIGAGQLILFSNSPTFRAATPATKRLLANAVVYGPGMGASQPIRP